MSSNTRLSAIIAVVIIAGLLAATWFVGIAPRLGEIEVAEADRGAVQAQNTAHEATIRSLEELAMREGEMQDELDEVRASIPDGVELSSILRRLELIASSTGSVIKVSSMEGPTRYQPLDSAAAPEAGGSNAFADPEYLDALETVTPDNFFTITLSLEIVGDYRQTMAAVEQIQLSERFTLVNDVVFEAEEPTVITGQFFLLLDASDVPPPPIPDTAVGEDSPELE
jgi:Tfp pilus assembly protein PilO